MIINDTFEIAKLELRKGDTVVVKTDVLLSKDQVMTIRERLAPMLPDGIGIIVLTGGMTMEILRRGDDAETACSSTTT